MIPSLARLVRGLSALFWGLPLALLLSARTALADWWIGSGWIPIMAAHGVILFGLWQLRFFQPTERVWLSALDRTALFAWSNLALAPSAWWWSHRPDETFFQQGFILLSFSGIGFLLSLNHALKRLVAMIPDEVLRTEARFFAGINSRLLLGLLFVLSGFLLVRWVPNLPKSLWWITLIFGRVEGWHFLMPIILPVALTMTILWKAKEYVLTSLFR